MDIPKYNYLLKSITGIDMEDEAGKIIKFQPIHVRRGSGNSKNCIFIEGFSIQNIRIGTQYFVKFKGIKYMASVPKVIEDKDKQQWDCELHLLISDADFWLAS